MRIIIDIPEEEYKCVQITGHIGNATQVSNAIFNSTPLDDVKAIMESARHFYAETFKDNPIDYEMVEGFDRAIEILDRVGQKKRERR